MCNSKACMKNAPRPSSRLSRGQTKAPPPKRAPRPVSQDTIDWHSGRVRRICLALPGASEKPSHGEPTFFVEKRVFAMLSLNHHDDGRIAVVVPLADDVQGQLLAASPAKYFYPSYVGVRGWVGIHLARVSDKLLKSHITQAWTLVAPRRLLKGLAGTAVHRPGAPG